MDSYVFDNNPKRFTMGKPLVYVWMISNNFNFEQILFQPYSFPDHPTDEIPYLPYQYKNCNILKSGLDNVFFDDAMKKAKIKYLRLTFQNVKEVRLNYQPIKWSIYEVPNPRDTFYLSFKQDGWIKSISKRQNGKLIFRDELKYIPHKIIIDRHYFSNEGKETAITNCIIEYNRQYNITAYSTVNDNYEISCHYKYDGLGHLQKMSYLQIDEYGSKKDVYDFPRAAGELKGVKMDVNSCLKKYSGVTSALKKSTSEHFFVVKNNDRKMDTLSANEIITAKGNIQMTIKCFHRKKDVVQSSTLSRVSEDTSHAILMVNDFNCFAPPNPSAYKVGSQVGMWHSLFSEIGDNPYYVYSQYTLINIFQNAPNAAFPDSLKWRIYTINKDEAKGAVFRKKADWVPQFLGSKIGQEQFNDAFRLGMERTIIVKTSPEYSGLPAKIRQYTYLNPGPKSFPCQYSPTADFELVFKYFK
jgi:hypothetical protein